MIEEIPAPVSDRRYWLTITVASFLQMVAVLVLTAAAVYVVDGDQTQEAAIASAVGLMLVPAVVAVLVIGTQRPEPGLSTLKAMALFIVVLIAGGLVTPLVGITAGMVVAAIIATQPRVDDTAKARWVTGGAFVFYVLVLLGVAPAAGVFAAAVLPTLTVSLTDIGVGWWRSRSGSPNPEA